MFEIDNRTNLLCTLLKCGTEDLALLDDVEYDFECILEYCESLDDLSLNSLMRAVFSIGIGQIEEILEDELDYFESFCSGDDDNKIDALKNFDPFNDIQYFCNRLGTHVYFVDDEVRELYQKYLPKALDIFERNTGFRIS